MQYSLSSAALASTSLLKTFTSNNKTMIVVAVSFAALAASVVTGLPQSTSSSTCEYNPGLFWMEDCNTCYCLQTGIKSCTTKVCDTRTKSTSCTSSGQVRNDGDSWWRGKVFCTCKSGAIRCTRKSEGDNDENKCIDSNGRSHRVGDAWKESCNTCRCLASGNPGCTRNICN